MRILVVGSLHHLRREERSEALPFFARVCRSIGAQIAVRNHTLIVGTESENCADRYFAEGAENSGAKVHLVVIRAQTGDSAFVGWEQRVAKLERKVTAASTWFDTRSYQVRNADAILLIGGKKGTRDVFDQALVFGRPVVPLGFVGGTAETLFSETSVKENISTSAAEFLKGRDAWNKGRTPVAAVETAEQLFSKQPVLVHFTHYLSALPSHGTQFAKRLLHSLKWLVLAAAGAAVGLAVKEQWPSIVSLFETSFQ